MQQESFRRNNNCANAAITHISYNTNVHRLIHNSTALVPVLSQISALLFTLATF